MAYTTINKSTDYFNTKLYTGTGSTNALTGVGFQPDFVWLKVRSTTGAHRLCDAVRGATKLLQSSANDAEQTGADTLTSFDSDGFTLGADAAPYKVNVSGQTMAAWCWKANGAGSSNSDGSITSTVSANTTAGFSIVKYNGTGANATVGHGLGVAPKVIMVKNLENSYEWIIGHEDLDTNGTGFSDNWYFNGFSTGARNQNATASWNSTSPTNSVFSLHSGATYMNASGEANIAYCFAEKTGYSKFGKYTGNGNADGTFVYTGFKPAFVMFKGNNTSNWQLWDNKRDTFNPVEKALHPDATAVASTDQDIDFLSNGFKIRGSVAHINGSGVNFYYMAFGNTIVGTNNIPATAR